MLSYQILNTFSIISIKDLFKLAVSDQRGKENGSKVIVIVSNFPNALEKGTVSFTWECSISNMFAK